MKALILVGGYGTRLRPLTFSKPKPIIHLLNVPVVMHQIKALAEVGVTDVVLAISFSPDVMKKELEEECRKIGVSIHFSIETTPLGTAGPIRLAKDILTKDGNDLFFVLNSDVTANYPFKELLSLFKKTGKEGCIVGKKVKDPSRFGVIVHDEKFRIHRFVEKPKEFVGDLINAGMYLLSTKVIDRIPERKTSIERETFPAMAKDGELYCLPYYDFWMDIGKPVSFLEGQELLFNHKAQKAGGKPEDTEEVHGRILHHPQTVLIHPSVKIGKGSEIGPYVSIGKNCVIGEGVKISNSTLMEGCILSNYCSVDQSIIGWASRIGKWAKVKGNSVLGEDVSVKEGIYCNGVIVCPHKGVEEDVYTEKIIL